MITRYVIVGNRRSGTSATHIAVKGHPLVSALNDECAVTLFSKGIDIFTNGYKTEAEEKRSHWLLFDAVTGGESTGHTKAQGLKTAIDDPAKAVELVTAIQQKYNGLKVIVVKRKDIVAQYASLQRASVTGQWHSWVKPGIADYTITVDLNYFNKYLLSIINTNRIIDKLASTNEVLEYSYENDLMNNRFDRLFHFIGAAPMPVTWMSSEKVAPEPKAYITNYKEVSEACMYFSKHVHELEYQVERYFDKKNSFMNKALQKIKAYW